MAEQNAAVILNVDDNSGSLYAKTRVLRHAGFTVVEAQTGTQALIQAIATRPDLVLLDVHLPDISGIEVCRRLKGEPTTAHLLVLQISASFVEVGDKTRGLEAGADGYLTEPVQPEELIATVRAFLRLHQAEVALRTSEERFRTTFEHVAIGMAHVATDGRWLRVNRRLCEILGYSGDELLQTDAQSITHPDDLPASAENMTRMARGDLAQYAVEKRYRRKDGSYCWARLTAVPLYDGTTGNVRYFVAAIEDISARKQAEDRLALMADISRLLIAPLDYETILQQVAERLTPQLADWCAVDLLNHENKLELLVVAHADAERRAQTYEVRKRLRRELQAELGSCSVVRTGRSELYNDITREMLAAPGIEEETVQMALEVGHHALMIVPLQGRNRILGALTLVQSHDHRRFTEDDLAFAEEVARRMAIAVDGAQLFRTVQETAIQVQQINAALQAQMAAREAELDRIKHDLNEFVFVASDDLRSPLRGIKHLAGWIAEDATGQLAARSQEHLQKLQGRTQRMEQLLDDLLLYTRIGYREEAPEEVAIPLLIHQVIRLLNPPAGFTVTTQGELPTLRAVRSQLELIFRHLLGNAVKHHHQPANGQVQISARELGDVVEFAIADDGPGIASHHHQRVFQIFQTLRPRDEVEGSGMGLPIVKKTIERQNGTITLESTPGAGCTVRFTWPKEQR